MEIGQILANCIDNLFIFALSKSHGLALSEFSHDHLHIVASVDTLAHILGTVDSLGEVSHKLHLAVFALLMALAVTIIDASGLHNDFLFILFFCLVDCVIVTFDQRWLLLHIEVLLQQGVHIMVELVILVHGFGRLGS